MKVEYMTGCTVSCIDVDKEDIRDLSASKMAELKNRLIGFLEAKVSEEDLQDLLLWTVETYGTTEHQYHCEQCGDDIYKTTLNI